MSKSIHLPQMPSDWPSRSELHQPPEDATTASTSDASPAATVQRLPSSSAACLHPAGPITRSHPVDGEPRHRERHVPAPGRHDDDDDNECGAVSPASGRRARNRAHDRSPDASSRDSVAAATLDSRGRSPPPSPRTTSRDISRSRLPALPWSRLRHCRAPPLRTLSRSRLPALPWAGSVEPPPV